MTRLPVRAGVPWTLGDLAIIGAMLAGAALLLLVVAGVL